MRRYSPLIYILLLLTTFISKTFGQQPGNTTGVITITDPAKPALLGKQLFVFVDSGGKSDINDIVTTGDFKPAGTDVPNLGVSDVTVWVKVPVNNQSRYRDIILEVENPLLDEVAFYYPGKNGYTEQLITKDRIYIYSIHT